MFNFLPLPRSFRIFQSLGEEFRQLCAMRGHSKSKVVSTAAVEMSKETSQGGEWTYPINNFDIFYVEWKS